MEGVSRQRDDELTICTVSFHNARHIALNGELVAALNKTPDRIKWIVAENTPAGGKDRLELFRSAVPGGSRCPAQQQR